MLGNAIACASTAAAVALLGAGPATALDLDRQNGLSTETVASRQRLKDYDNIKQFGAERVTDRDRKFLQPDGLRVGNFYVLPALEEVGVYDDNIFGSNKDPVADFRMETLPSLVIQSAMPRHSIDAAISGKIVNYLENTDQNYESIVGKLRGALHIDHANTLSALIQSGREHEERSGLTADKSAAEPVPIDHHRAAVGFTHDAGRLYGTVSAGAEQWKYYDVRSLDGSTLSQSDRDQELYEAQIRMGYRISPGFEFVTKFRALRQINEPDDTGDRNSIGYEALAGLAMESDPLLRWRLLGGYGIRDFDRSDLASVANMLLEGQVEWLPTQRLTLFGSVQHAIVDTFGADDDGRIETSLKGSAAYELLHNLVGYADFAIKETDYLGSDRQDRTWQAGAGLEYLHTKNWSFSLGYQFENRESNDQEFDRTRNQVRVGAKLAF